MKANVVIRRRDRIDLVSDQICSLPVCDAVTAFLWEREANGLTRLVSVAQQQQRPVVCE